MIKFDCQMCGHNYQVPDKYAGKKVRCKECNEIFIVPILNDDKHQTVQLKHYGSIADKPAKQPCSVSVTPIRAWCLFGVLGVFFISFVLYMFVFRDTWEIDHYSELSNLIRDASRYYQAEEYQLGIKKYDKLCFLIGDRELKKEELRKLYSEMQGRYAPLKKKIRGSFLISSNRAFSASSSARFFSRIANLRLSSSLRFFAST